MDINSTNSFNPNDPKETNPQMDKNEANNSERYSPPFVQTFGDFQGTDQKGDDSIPGLSTLIATLVMIVMAILVIIMSLKKIDDTKYIDIIPIYSSREIDDI